VLPLLSERAREQGVEWLVACPPDAEGPMLRTFDWAGFERFTTRRDSYRLFHRKVRFEPIVAAATDSS